VYEVSRDECFYAIKDSGAFLNGKHIHVSQRKTLSESLVATGFPIYNFERIDSFLNALKYFMQHTHGVRRIGAAAADLCYLACGRVDAFFEYNLHPWDVAAGALIVKEAGGKVNDFSGKDNWLYGKEIACTNGLLDEEFHSVIRRFFGRGRF
jgi:myo-inositol-1(or 4)-monophosphatase